MEPTGRVLGPASTNFNDYLGTVAADDANAVIYEPSLYELAELDRDRYTILAVDLRVDGRTTATVYAMDRVEHPDALTNTERGQSHCDVPVVSFDLPEARSKEFIRRAFRQDLGSIGDTAPPRPPPGPYRTESTEEIEA